MVMRIKDTKFIGVCLDFGVVVYVACYGGSTGLQAELGD